MSVTITTPGTGTGTGTTEATTATTPAARRIPIYTRTGDKGSSSLFTGERRAKDDVVFEALGATDELSSALGLAREYCVDAGNDLHGQLEMARSLYRIQCLLQDAGSNIATPRTFESQAHLARTEFDMDGEHARSLEQWIDELENRGLPPLRNFILPSGGKAAATLHLSRSICRRAERRITSLVHDGETSPSVARYLNRLSDYLFTAARYAAFKEGRPEQVYRRLRHRTSATATTEKAKE
ncbi:Adenosylcobalamin biosynthesis, ATP:cob(I)alamin adenosyltransferase-like protein [Blastocladiella britannica]|nr:Adenosylcobalamin biosynthesis, ATP:cob(I)alamin adenosyltransferase-like protein [Blastocladiella britannica]